MHCTLCQSVNSAELTAEIIIHFAGLGNIDHPGLPAFPKVSVCLNCGACHFTLPESELALLLGRTAKSDAKASARAA